MNCIVENQVPSSTSSSNDVLMFSLPFPCVDYALHFPYKVDTDYAIISSGMPSLNEFTLCYWMKSTDKSDATPFSYCTQSYGNELLIFDYGKSTSLTINGEERETRCDIL